MKHLRLTNHMTEIVPDNKALPSIMPGDAPNASVEKPRLQIRVKSGLKRAAKFVSGRLISCFAECVAIFLGLAFLWFCTINYVLQKGEVDISFLGRNAEIWFSEAFNGQDASVGKMTLDWVSVDNGFVFTSNAIILSDKDGNVIERISKFQTEIGVRSALLGKLEARRVKIQGGIVSIVRGTDGKLIIGVGAPDHVGTFGPIWTGKRSRPRELAALPEMKFPKDLRSFDLTDGQAFVIDKRDGVEILLKDANLTYRNLGTEVRATLEATIKKALPEVSDPEASDKDNQEGINAIKFEDDFDNDDESAVALAGLEQGAVQLSFMTVPNSREADIKLSFKGINPSHYAPKRGPLAAIAGFDLGLDLSFDIVTGEEKGLKTALIDLAFGAGTIDFAGVNEPIENLSFLLDFDRPSSRVDIQNLNINTHRYGGKGTVLFESVFNGRQGLSDTEIPITIDLRDVRLDLNKTFEKPFTFPSITSKAAYFAQTRIFGFEQTKLDFGTYTLEADVTGQLGDKKPLKALQVKTEISGLFTESDLLHLWPVTFVDGARNWIKRSVSNAEIENLKAMIRVTEEHFEGAPLGDENLQMTFDIPQADVRYISTMTPYLGASGSGWMRGNRARFLSDGGRVGNIDIRRGQVDFPQLFPRGGLLIIDLEASGQVSDLLGLIDEKPFMFASQYGVNPTEFGGVGAVNLKITRPLLVNFDKSRIDYSGSGNFQDFSAPFGIGKYKISSGDVRLEVDKAGLSVQGPVLLGAWRTDISLRETFDNGATPTQYTLKGPMTQADLDSFGLGIRSYFGGTMDVSADAIGTGVNIMQANVTASLVPSELNFGNLWTKPIGDPGDLKFSLLRSEQGVLSFDAINIKAPGLSANGAMSFTQDFKLLELNLPTLSVDGVIQGQIKAQPSVDGESLGVQITGDYLDLSSFTKSVFSGKPSEFKVPVNVTTKVERLMLNPSYSLKDASLDFYNMGEGVERAVISGDVRGGKFFASLLPNEGEGGRSAQIKIPNASDAAFAFFNMDNITGGVMTVAADLPEVGQTGMVRGTVNVEDFTLVKAPILAQILSLASLKGLTDVLGGAGLSFRELSVPFGWENGNLSIRDARASGAGLGLTGSGEIDFENDFLDLDGVLVPAYTANSVLGDLPLFGDLFVGKKGEGILALNYIVKGPMKQSQIAVNPLSALTPGFLRRIFDVKRTDLPDKTKDAIKSVTPQPE